MLRQRVSLRCCHAPLHRCLIVCMARTKPLIVGLGNPGANYRGTRHNVGFSVVDALEETTGIAPTHDNRANALVGWGRHAGLQLGLMKPLTLMNRSGSAVRHVVNYSNVNPADMLVVYDDINLPVGRIRLRPKGGAGGHNGLQDIINQLQTKDFPRLRIGIGNDFPRGEQSRYVLSRFTPEQQPAIEGALNQAADAALRVAADGIDEAMNQFN